jgi:RimJ/RimL family protein N-acetyltransferase
MKGLPTMRGEMVTLRPIAARDADGMWEMVSQDPEGTRQTGSRQFTREEVDHWCATVAEREGRADWAITHAGDEFLGEIVLNQIDEQSRNANLRLSLRPGHRGRGFGGEAIALVLDHAFAPDGLGLHRVSLDVLSINPRALALYESFGFSVEGRLREAHLDGEHWCDVIVMALLADDWRAQER